METWLIGANTEILLIVFPKIFCSVHSQPNKRIHISIHIIIAYRAVQTSIEMLHIVYRPSMTETMGY